MLDSNDKSYIDIQNKAHLFAATQAAKQEIQKISDPFDKKILDIQENIAKTCATTLEKCKNYTDILQHNITKSGLGSCTAKDNTSVSDENYPIGTIISVGERNPDHTTDPLPYAIVGPKVNDSMDNIFVRQGDGQDTQLFYWFGGKEYTNEHNIKLPGVWRSRGLCGYFKSEASSYKFFLAQRTA